MRLLTYLMILLVAMAGVVFASLNPTPVVVHYLVATIELPVSVLVVISMGLGLLVGLAFTLVVYLKLKRHIFQLKSRAKVAQQEIDNLRSLPIREPH